MFNLFKLYNLIPPYLKTKYVLALIIFGAWILFFDRNNLFSQAELYLDLSELKEKEAYYEEKIGEVNRDQEELLTDQKSIEKFAREQYWMKKDNEDIFIIVDEE